MSKISSSEEYVIRQSQILRGPEQVSLDITNECNFRCLHCYNSSGENVVKNHELSDEQVKKLMEDLGEMQILNLCFCGGEPLLRKELIYESAKILKSKGVVNVSMVTNGYFLTEEIAKKLFECGVRRTQVSLDGANAKSYERMRGVKGGFERAINALRIFKKVGMENLDMAFCPTNFNVGEIKDVYKIACEIGVNSLRIQPLMLLGRANENLANIIPSEIQYRQLVNDIDELKKDGQVNVDWGDPIDHIIRFRDLTKHCCTFVSIRANGDIVPSPYLPITVGNIKKHTFKEYWDNNLSRVWELNFIKEIANNISCIDDMNKVIEGIPIVWKEDNINIDIIDDQKYRIKSI